MDPAHDNRDNRATAGRSDAQYVLSTKTPRRNVGCSAEAPVMYPVLQVFLIEVSPGYDVGFHTNSQEDEAEM